MTLKKYILLALITLSLTISESFAVNLKLKFLDSTAVAQTVNDRKAEADRLLEQGRKQFRSSQFKQALQSWEESLAIYREIGDTPEGSSYANREGIANSLGNLGIVYASLGDYRKAIDYQVQSLAISKEIGNRLGQAQSLNNLGNAYQKLKDYENAEKNLRQAIGIWENIRSDLGNQDTNKVTIFDTQTAAYTLLQEVLVAQKRPQQALEIAERGRTRALVEILIKRTNPQLEENIIPPSLNLTQIKQVAQKQNATLVEYSLTPDEIYIWVIPPGGEIQFRAVSLKGVNLEKLVKITRENRLGVRGRGSDNSASKQDNCSNCLKQLHKLLIEPIAEFLPKNPEKRVIFIPHQELFLVPFVALQDQDNKYLIEKHTILSAPSIQALSLNEKDRQTQQKQNTPTLPRGQSALIVGNPTMPKKPVGKDKKPLEQLKGAESEAKEIAKMLGAKPIIRDQATESTIVQKMASAKLIHLATHGLLDGDGAIALTPSGKDDGFLTTVEIMERFGLPGKQKLQADLVVLSACDTGRGDIKGEGVIGLSRAFMASGVPTLVVSLWKVPDGETATLMKEFYTNIDEGESDKAKAMREAMLTMIEDGDPDPRNWAAFTVIGKAK